MPQAGLKITLLTFIGLTPELFSLFYFQREIKDAYLRLSKVWHPDLHQNAEEESSKKTADLKFREIVAAYEILSDPQKRRNYDFEIGVVDKGSISTTQSKA